MCLILKNIKVNLFSTVFVNHLEKSVFLIYGAIFCVIIESGSNYPGKNVRLLRYRLKVGLGKRCRQKTQNDEKHRRCYGHLTGSSLIRLLL